MKQFSMTTEVDNIPTNYGTRNFQFTAEEVISHKRNETKKDVCVTINTKYGHINFSTKAIQSLNLLNNRIKFYVDTGNKTIAFKLKNKFDSFEQLGNWRLPIQNKDSGNVTFSIVPIIRELGINGKLLERYKKIRVQKWKDQKSILDGDEYYFVDLKEYERKNKN